MSGVGKFYVEHDHWASGSSTILARAKRGGDRIIARGLSVAYAERIVRLLNADEATGGRDNG